MKYTNMMHGTQNDFNSFSSKYFGEGEGQQQYGDGFYFSDNEDVAFRYLGEGKNGFIIYADVTLNNPIHVDGMQEANLRHVMLTGEESLCNLMKMHPNIYNQPDAEDSNPLGDYIPEFWNKKKWTKKELDSMIEEMVREYYAHGSLLHLENFFACEGGIDIFHEGVRKYFGYDGIVVDWPERDIEMESGKTIHHEESIYAIAWFPEQITITGKDRVEHGTISTLSHTCGQSMFIPKEGMNELVKMWADKKLGHTSNASFVWSMNTIMFELLTHADKMVVNELIAAAPTSQAMEMFDVPDSMMFLPASVTEFYLPEILSQSGMANIGEVVKLKNGMLLLEGHFPVAN